MRLDYCKPYCKSIHIVYNKHVNDKALQFLKNKNPKLCVLATASADGKPEAAVMGYAVQDDLTILLSTHKGNRKWQNLSKNSKVSLVFGWSFTEINIQYDGTATLIEEGPQKKEVEEFFFSQNPAARKFETPDTIFIQVKPVWIRLSDLTQTPPTTEEASF